MRMEARSATAGWRLPIRFGGHCLPQFFQLQQQQEEAVFRVLISPPSDLFHLIQGDTGTKVHCWLHWLNSMHHDVTEPERRTGSLFCHPQPSHPSDFEVWKEITHFPRFPLILPHPPEASQFETDLRRIKKKNYVKHILIKYLARKPEWNI